MTRRRTAVLVVAALAVTASCGGETTTERPLTGQEASRMAAIQVTNMRDGGATFEVATADTATGLRLSLRGDVDWADHSGRATVGSGDTRWPVTEVAWLGGTVLERRTDAAPLLVALGFPPDAWVSRPIDPANAPIDRIIGILMKLSSTDPDNAILIQQQEGSAFLREDVLRGDPVDVLRYGTRSVYWVEAGTDALKRFEGNNASFTSPVIIDFEDRGPRDVPLPDKSLVVPHDRLRSLGGTTTP